MVDGFRQALFKPDLAKGRRGTFTRSRNDWLVAKERYHSSKKSSVNPQYEFSQMVFSKCLVRLADFFQTERSVDVHCKWTGID